MKCTIHVHYTSPNIETSIHDLQSIQVWSDVAYQLRQQENALGLYIVSYQINFSKELSNQVEVVVQ